MKKITLLCFLAMGSSVATWAKVGDKITKLEQLSNNKYYTILPQENERGTWTTNENDPTYLYSTYKTGESVDDTKPSQQFAFIQSESGKYYVYSIGANKFLAYTKDKEQSVALVSELLSTDVEAAFVASTNATHKDQYPWVVALNGHHVGISNSYDTGIITFFNNTADGGNCISITEAGDFDPTNALAKIKVYEDHIPYLNDGKKFLAIPEGAVGQYDPALINALKAACGEDGVLDFADVMTEAGKKAVQDLRDAETEAKFSNDKVYKIRNMSEGNGFLLTQAEEGKSRIFTSTRNGVQPTANSEYWQVYTEGEYSFLYNLGTKTFARYNANTDQWELSETPAFVKVIRNLDKNVATFAIQDQRSLGELQYLHVNNGVGETGVVGWETANDATNFYFIEQPGQTADDLNNKGLTVTFEKENANNLIKAFIEGKEGYIGNYPAQGINELKTLVGKENVTSKELKDKIQAVKESRNMPVNGKYYIIQSTMAFNDGKARSIFENPDGTNIAWSVVAQSPAELWQFEEKGEGKYYLKSANTGKYVKLDPGMAPATMNEDKSTAFSFEDRKDVITLGIMNYPEGGDKATMTMQGSQNWGSIPGADQTSGSFVGSYNDNAEKYANKWNIIEANSVKITISDAKYATVWLPYAVNLNEKVEAYTIGSIANGYATLKKIEGNVIPAETAAILYAAAGTYEFSIAADNTQDAIKSDLQGTAIRTEVGTGVNAYILGNVEGKVGFYQMSDGDRAIAANKAYLVLPAEAQAIRSIIIGGPTTGIEDTVAEGAEAEEYYDLQGRRVMNPVKGIYVTKSGKKVVFNK